MPSAVRLREDYSAAALRGLARRSRDVNQSRRLLSLAAVRDGTDRGAAAKIGGMDRQTLRDWVHRFNGSGPEGLVDNWTSLAFRRSNWISSRRSSRRVRIVRRTGSCAGVGSTSSASSPRGRRRLSSALCRKAPQKTRLLPHQCAAPSSSKTSGPLRLSKKLPARAEGPSRGTAGDDAGRNLV
jgi:hypothetical protein